MTITHTVTMETITKIVPPEYYHPISARLEKIEARCERKGFPAPSLNITEIYHGFGAERIGDETYHYEPGDRKIVIEVPNVKVNGWKLIARVDFMDTESGRRCLVSTVPGETTPAWAHSIDESCEHCHKTRVRNRVYLFRNEKQWKRVGSTCTQDYLGLDAAMLLHCSQGRTWYDDPEGETLKTAKYWGLHRYLTAVATCVRKAGFRKSNDDAPTWISALVLRVDLARPFAMDPERRKDWTPTDEDAKLAKDAIEHFKAQTNFDRMSDYLRNIAVLADCPMVDRKRLPLAASMIVAYQRVLERRVADAQAAKDSGGHFGTIGQRIKSIAVKIKSVRTFETAYGWTTLYSMIDDENRSFVWYSSRNFDAIKVGSDQVITGTVKAHNEYRGVPQTVVTRCKWA